MQAAVDDIWPYTHELFEDDALAQSLKTPDWRRCRPSLEPQWTEMVDRRPRPRHARRARRRLAAKRRPRGPAHRAPVVPARRDAGAASRPPGGDMVTSARRRWRQWWTRSSGWSPSTSSASCARSIADEATGRVTVTITPTYSGCPAMDVIRADITRALAAAGYPEVEVRTVLRPAWTTEMISAEGRRKLAAAGIAPPTTTRPSVVALAAERGLSAVRIARHRGDRPGSARRPARRCGAAGPAPSRSTG